MDPNNLRLPSSGAETALFIFCAILAILGAIATVALRNPIRCAVGLFFHVIALAGLYLTLNAHFLGVIQLLVYAGAVVVLFVFVIMLLGPAADPPSDNKAIASRSVGAVAVAAMGGIILTAVAYAKAQRFVAPNGYGTLREIGTYIFTKAVIPFELIGITLVVAVVGAFAVARGHHKKRDISPDENQLTPQTTSGATPAKDSGEAKQ